MSSTTVSKRRWNKAIPLIGVLLVLGISAFTLLAVVDAFPGQRPSAQPGKPMETNSESSAISSTTQESPLFANARRMGLDEEQAQQAVLQLLQTHKNIPDWVVLYGYQRKNVDAR
jgi:hypothetical protein